MSKYTFFGNNNNNNNKKNDAENQENQSEELQGFQKFKRRQKSPSSQNVQQKQKKSEIEGEKEKTQENLENQENQENQENVEKGNFYKRRNLSEKLEKLNKRVENKIDEQAQKNHQEYEDFEEKKIKKNQKSENSEILENQEVQFEQAQGFEKFKRRKSAQKKGIKENNESEKKMYDDIEKKLEREEDNLEKEQEQLEKKIKEVKENLTKEEELRRRSERIMERSRKLKEKLDPIKSERQLQEEKEQQEQQEEKLKPKGFTQNDEGFFNKKKKDGKKSSSPQKPKMFREEGEKEKNKESNKFNTDPNQPKFNKWLLLGMAFLGGFGIVQYFQESEFSKKPISYSEFMKMYLEKGNVERISIKRKSDQKVGSVKTFAKIYTKDGDERSLEINHLDHFLQILEQTQVRQGKTPDQYIVIDFNYTVKKPQIFEKIVSLFLVGANIYVFYLIFKGFQQMRGLKGGGGGLGDMMGPSKVKVYGLDTKMDIKFKDVAGQEEAKLEIMEFVDFLKNPKKYTDLGATIPKGALLSGPPGTGKTLLAKACAGEAEVPFFFMAGSDFVEMFVGVGSQRVRDLFKQAKAKQPSIVFIDEIDAIGKKRNNSGKGNDERENTLNQMLVEMDGFGTSQQVVVLAATNRADMLDPALLRPGRFDRKIEVSLPDIDGRKEIFMVHLKGLKLDLAAHTKEDYARRLATLTPGFSGADIANLCNEAALITARKNKSKIQTIDFEMASERVMAGIEKKSLMHKDEKRVVAVHEAGHAVVGWFLEGGSPLIKVTIIPRSKGSLGYAQYLPNEGSLQTEQELYDQICAALGGRVAEQIFFGKITNGASNDLEKVYKMALNMVEKLGMSDKIGYQGFKETQGQKVYSKATHKIIDDEVKRIIHEQTARCEQLILEKRSEIEALSEALLEKETLDLRQIKAIIGDRPFEAKSNYKAYLQEQDELEKEVQEQKEEEIKQHVEENIDPEHNQNEIEFEKRNNGNGKNKDENNDENDKNDKNDKNDQNNNDNDQNDSNGGGQNKNQEQKQSKKENLGSQEVREGDKKDKFSDKLKFLRGLMFKQ